MSTVSPPPPSNPTAPAPPSASTPGGGPTGLPGPAGSASGASAGASAAGASGSSVSSGAWTTAHTPGWLRVQGAAAVIAVGLLAVVGVSSALTARGATGTIRDDVAPSLIAVQGLSASVAEANTNATAAFLGTTQGAEDRQRRVGYLDARRRSAEQLEEVASLIGDDPAGHRNLQDVAVALTDYSGVIESARTAALAGDEAAVDDLRRALDLTGTDVAASISEVTAAGQDSFDEQSSAGRLLSWTTIVVALGALGLLARIQWRLVGLTNRLINPGLAAASLLVAVTLVWTLSATGTKSGALANADDGGYRSIALTSRLQAAANEVQTGLSLSLLGGADDTSFAEPLDRLTSDADELVALADSPREQAAAEALAARLARYRSSAERIAALAAAGQTGAAVTAFQDRGLSDFNGLNTSIEAVLSDNRNQFTDGVAGAADAVGLLPFVAVILPVLAALAIVAGIQQRLREYV